MNKCVLFLEREECLVWQFSQLSKYIDKEIDILHVAFSSREEIRLDDMGIHNYIRYSSLFKKYLKDAPEPDILKIIDDDIIKNAAGSFTLNSAMQSDRGFSMLSYEDALRVAQAHYMAWNEILSSRKVDLIVHEPNSLFFNFIAQVLCRKYGGNYLFLIQARPEFSGYSYLNCFNDNYSCPEIERKYKYYIENPSMINHERVDSFLASFRKDYSVFFGSEIHKSHSVVSFYLKSIREKLISVLAKKRYDKIEQNINYWMAHNHNYSNKLRNIRDYKRRGIKFLSEIPEGESYYYYSMHLEPEAVVLYLAEGVYTNQIKLIENIAASLPAGSYLYVKDHPHEFAYRCADDYERLMKVPNIRLIHQGISGKTLISKAKGVFSINGTAGFEGLLLNKQVFCFGNNYYSVCDRVSFIKNVRDIRKAVYSKIETHYTDDDVLYAYVNAYLDSLNYGLADYTVPNARSLDINMEENFTNLASNIKRILNELFD